MSAFLNSPAAQESLVDDAARTENGVQTFVATGSDSPSAPLEARNVWYEKTWTILGVAYASTKLTYDFEIDGVNVTNSLSCTPTFSNLIPLRTVNTAPEHFVADGKGTCKTVWTVVKGAGTPAEYQASSEQGLRTNGAGDIEAQWGPDDK